MRTKIDVNSDLRDSGRAATKGSKYSSEQRCRTKALAMIPQTAPRVESKSYKRHRPTRSAIGCANGDKTGDSRRWQSRDTMA
jgi:hypothetical protein